MKTNRIFLLVILLTLTGCASVKETFKNGEFHTAEFKDNYYSFMPKQYKEGSNYTSLNYDVTSEIKSVSLRKNFFAFNTIILSDLVNQDISLSEVIELYGDTATKTLKQSDFPNEESYSIAVFEALNSSYNATWMNYANHNSLTTGNYGPRVNEAFKQGVFSKLTDTLIKCDGSGSLVRMQINEDGIGQVFQHELIDYRNFVISMRGGTNVDYAALSKATVESAKVQINISFYIEKSTTSAAYKHTLSFVIDELDTDNSSYTTVAHLDLSQVFPANTFKRVSGMSINYELLEHEYLMPGGTVDESVDGVFALMLYEVMFPYSTWR